MQGYSLEELEMIQAAVDAHRETVRPQAFDKAATAQKDRSAALAALSDKTFRLTQELRQEMEKAGTLKHHYQVLALWVGQELRTSLCRAGSEQAQVQKNMGAFVAIDWPAITTQEANKRLGYADTQRFLKELYIP